MLNVSTNKQVIFLMGPTAAGKTSLAIKLATQFPIDIISVDSAMIYTGMNIGTGKPNATELGLAPHALIDILDPSQIYSAADFCKAALHHMQQSHSNARIPVLVGGSMMYFKALQYGLSNLPAQNQELRDQILQQAAQFGWEHLHNKLAKLDLDTARRIHRNDSQRIQRALEIIYLTGMPMSESLNKHASPLAEWQIHLFALAPSTRATLHANIQARFNTMLQQGFIAEVQDLFKRSDLHINLPALRAVGYRQIWEYLNNHTSCTAMQDKVLAATRQLAKRQLTWLRSWDNLTWLESNNAKNIELMRIPNLLQVS